VNDYSEAPKAGENWEAGKLVLRVWPSLAGSAWCINYERRTNRVNSIAVRLRAGIFSPPPPTKASRWGNRAVGREYGTGPGTDRSKIKQFLSQGIDRF